MAVYPIPPQLQQMWGKVKESLPLPEVIANMLMEQTPQAAMQSGIMNFANPLGMVLYHQTTPQASEAIMKEGFKVMPLKENLQRANDYFVPEGIFLKKGAKKVERLPGTQLKAEIPDNLNILDIGNKMDEGYTPSIWEHLSQPARKKYEKLLDKYENLTSDLYLGDTSSKATGIVGKMQKLITKDLQKQGYHGVSFLDDIPDDIGMPSGKYLKTHVIFDPSLIKVK